MAEKFMKKDRAHQRYYVEVDGKKKRVPSVTSITGVLNKPALVPWANKLGLQGIDSRSYVDSRANMGTCAHNMVEAFLLGQEMDFDDVTPNERSQAENSVLSFHRAIEGKQFDVIGVEMQLVSEKMMVGGTCDIYWVVDGKYQLADLKTSKDIYPDQWDQVAAYAAILRENGYQVDEVAIINIPRSEDEKFKYELLPPEREVLHLEKFEHCRRIYELKKLTGENSWHR